MDYQSRSVDELIPYVNNARTHSEEQVTQLASSIKEFGFLNPIIIDQGNGVIAGHGRLMAAKKLGLESVPVLLVDHLTEAQKKAYVLADNQLGLSSGWDFDLLKVEIEGLQELDFDTDLLGFDEDFLDNLLFEEKEGLTDQDYIPDVPDDPITKPGDLWILGNHRLLCGDSTNIEDIQKLIDGNKIDLVFSDPPYGINVVQGNQVGGDKIVESKTYSKIIGDETTQTAQDFYNGCVALEFKNIVLWGGNYFTDFLKPSRCWLVWDKEMTGNFSEAEMAWTSFSKGGIKVFKFLWNGLSREGNRKDELSSRVHPTQKPVGLFVNIFERFDGFKNIFDGFGGSGSTLIACEKLKRKCFMIEMDQKYCDVIVKRWEEYTGKKAVLDERA